ncbi:MAG: hypothetical protein BAJALOKI1v1_1330011 [Promethearchaeota archaeon]|nr:MAG: hypothetical protein BAJALOKI1v1_1330011 [Candidatus Lokiarchaeota archaeon]
MTSHDVLLATIKVIQRKKDNFKKIYVMDNSAVGSFMRLVFQVDDLGKKIKKLGAKPLYLDEEKSIKIDFNGEVLDRKIPIPKILYENLIEDKNKNTYINIPRLKSHILAEATISIKNQLGLLYDKEKMYKHHLIHEKVVDIMNVFQPNFNLVDATTTVDYGPMAVFPEWETPMNLLISGIDPVAVDTIGSYLIGIDNIKHIEIAAERGFGINDLKQIEVLPSHKILDEYKIQLHHKNIPKTLPQTIKILRGTEKVCKTGCSFLDLLFIWFGTQSELKKCVVIYGKGHDSKELDHYDGPFIVNGPCAVKELKDYFQQRSKKDNIEVYYINEHLNIAAVGTAIRKAFGISLFDLTDLLPCSLIKVAFLKILAKLKGGKFAMIK